MREIHKPDAVLAKLLPPVTPRPDIHYVPSRYVLPFTHGGKDYAFHHLTRQCIEGALPASAWAGQGHDARIAARFLVPEGTDECELYRQLSGLLRLCSRRKGVGTYTILPTLSCNARCVYCYEEGMKQTAMTPGTAEQVVRYILDTCAGDGIRLSWFGGEPLLGVPVIDAVCRGLREAGLSYQSDMTSNGSLITPEIMERMTGTWNLSRIQISMDGAERDYLSRKRYAVPGDNYRRVMRAVSDMSAAGIRVTIRCNVDWDNWDGIPQYLADLESGVASREHVRICLAPLNSVRMSENDLAMYEKIRDARPLILRAGFRAVSFMGFDPARFPRTHCMADGGDVVIAPDGSLYPCEHCPPRSRFGDIWHGVTDEAAREEFCRTDRLREKCRTCPFLPDCTPFAGCPVQDRHCRQVHEMEALDALRRMVDKEESENTGRENVIC